MKRQILSLLFLLSLLITISPANEPRTVQVTFYHTSDIHEHSLPLPRIAGFIAARKKVDPNVLLVDTGDWCNKGDLTALKTRGEAITAMMSTCGYDALIPGNHDYSFGTKRLAELIDRFSLPVVAANCVWPEDLKPRNVATHKIFSLDGVTVAIIGTATPIATQQADTLLEILPLAESLRPLVATLRKQADIVVVLTHLGTPADLQLARAVPDIDIIFGGHDHRSYEELTLAPTTETVIQHSGANGQCLGELVVTWDGAKIVDREVRILAVTDSMPSSTAVAEIRDRYLSEATAESQPARK